MSLERRYKIQEGELGEGFGKRPNFSNLYIGIVKDNVDVQNMGRIRVWIPELGGDKNDPNNWITCSYVSPFAGASPLSANIKDSDSYIGTQRAYGMVMQPPHIDNEVLVGFVNGATNRAVYFGCLFQQNMNHSVPGMAANAEEITAGRPRSNSATEYNKFRRVPNTQQRPEFEPLSESLIEQGLRDDGVRGYTFASMRRSSPSNVYGFSTPRGHQIYVDEGRLLAVPNENSPTAQAAREDVERRRDAAAEEYIRIRTRSGVQILINDTTGYIYMITKRGNSWMELSDSSIDIYSRYSINIRSEHNVNIHADGSINLFGSQNFLATTDGALRLTSSETIDIRSDKKMRLYTFDKMNIKANSDVLIDGKNIRIKEKLAEEAIGTQIIELADIRSNGTITERTLTRTAVSELPHHEPYPHGYRDFGRDYTARADTPPSLPRTRLPNSVEVRQRIGRQKRAPVGAPVGGGSDASQPSSRFSRVEAGFGSCAFYEESGGINPEAYNPNDVGSPAYGIAQFNAGEGGFAAYYNSLRDRYPVIYARLEAAGGLQGARAGTPEFVAAWKSLAQGETREQFIESQMRAAKERWYDPTVIAIRNELGYDFESRSIGVREAVYSLSIQMGRRLAVRVVKNALQGKNFDEMTDEEIINALYDERGSVDEDGVLKYFRRFSQQVGPERARQQLQARYARERRCNIAKTLQERARREQPPPPDTIDI